MIQMERFSIIFFSCCSLAILAESMPIGSSTTIETLWDNVHEIHVRNIENYLLKPTNVQNNTEHLLLDENLMKNTTQVEEHVKNPLYLNKTSDTSIISTGDFSSSYINDTQHLKHNGSREDNANHKKEPSIDLSSHDILLDPDLILVRLSRQTGKSNVDYSKLASVENISRNVKSNNYDANRRIVTLKWDSNPKDDLSVAEDRYQPPYWNPYYRGQFPNQRYRTNDRREPYRNYWRYPVFPGK